ncbi:hypothetical protein FA95DRAFT_1579112 [Auriscalpium vulgare]|uniref:Uncharacterized protein n=1 Tax=Auriscalpium vulgare TaxID=40419 RepID=A0ACB8SCS4_9AGAM|nr:hypothetical protein FA95DRAFT_1579112 [Auriscalpium vulgare]
MSATALKALTNSNTTRNQHYVIVLETEVIRMTGSRPESPTTKVRTVLEKQKEDKARGRKERAERRARRSSSSGLDGDEGDEGDGGDSADLSMMSSDDFDAMGPNGQPLRHRRGAGEEEDFMTPDRPDRPAKRARLGSVEREEEGDREAKRVRWDRGLFKIIYFEVGKLELDGTERAKSLPPTPNPKGALAGSAKALRLDSLGNLVNCSSPLKDVVPENVTVKKFVYDSDVVEEEPPPKPVSKGKGKRAKSI